MLDMIKNLDLNQLITTIGYAGILLIIFAETGLFFGFFLPGDSLVFTAGMLASRGIFNIWILVPSIVVTAIVGYAVGYWFGDKLGHWLIKRPDSIYFKKRYMTIAHDFYERHGGKALVFGRLVPIVRTFAPIVAGMADMPYSLYTLYNILGALLWGGVITMIGYYIGGLFPNASEFVLPVVIAIVLISVIPGVVHYWRKRRSR